MVDLAQCQSVEWKIVGIGLVRHPVCLWLIASARFKVCSALTVFTCNMSCVLCTIFSFMATCGFTCNVFFQYQCILNFTDQFIDVVIRVLFC